jgi:hypothetical protein
VDLSFLMVADQRRDQPPHFTVQHRHRDDLGA